MSEPVQDSQQLTAQQRAEQAAIAAALVLELKKHWRLLNPLDLPASARLWLEAVLPVIRRFHARSSQSAAAWLTELRRVELRTSVSFNATLAADLNPQQVITSLMVTGPRRIEAVQKRLDALSRVTVTDGNIRSWAPPSSPEFERVKAVRLQKALDDAFTTSTAAAQRHVVNGGRETTVQTALADPRSKGWIRVGDGDPCWFCAMLISRGPVYKETSFDRSDPRFSGPGDYKVHDFDGCSMKPVYRDDDPAIAASDRYSALWSSRAASHSGKAAMQAFKQDYADAYGS